MKYRLQQKELNSRCLRLGIGMFAAVFAVNVTYAAPNSKSMIDISSKSVRIYNDTNPALQSFIPINNTSVGAVQEFIGQQRNNQVQNSLVTDSVNTKGKNGLTHLRMSQQVDGLTIYGTYVKSTVRRDGSISRIIENVVNIPSVIRPANISATQALKVTMSRYYPNSQAAIAIRSEAGNKTHFSQGNVFRDSPTATRVAIPLRDGSLEQGYLVQTWDRDNVLRHTLINAQGRIAYEQLRTSNDSYNIFPVSPGVSAQTIITGPGVGNIESPVGWVFDTTAGLTTSTTTGNNVDAYLDVDGNDIPDVGGRPISTALDFNYVADLTSDPNVGNNGLVAVTNLFYLNNMIHDKLYQHGFTESAGNFQNDNFGNGGLGGDIVLAEAQDGSGVNNANFSTPPDGTNGVMQMFVFNLTTPNRDGDLDSDIVWHEYGHGLTWRMIGNMSGQLSGAIGEGVSDVLAIIANDDDRMGEYAMGNAFGIRRAPYTAYPFTYGSVTGASVHDDGEIYAATIWRLWEIFQLNGVPKNTLYDYLIDGMNYTPSNPSYEDMRDGIIASVVSINPAHECLIWEAFAQYGIGFGAVGTEIPVLSITESFLQHAKCLETDPVPPDAVTDLSFLQMSSRSADIQFTVTGDDGMIGNATALDIRYDLNPITDASFATATRFVNSPLPTAPGTLQTVTVSGLSPITTYYFAVKVIDNVGNASLLSNVIQATTLDRVIVWQDILDTAANWTVSGTIGPNGPLWHLSTNRATSPLLAFYYGIDATLTFDTPGLANNGAITSIPIDLSAVTDPWLSFNHFLQGEQTAPFDTATVEVSTDGIIWQTVFQSLIATSVTIEVGVDISAYAGQIIQLRFSFDTVDSVANTFEGWVVDDITISATGTPPIYDTDFDGIPDVSDNCTLVANASQYDSNGDGFGNICDADLDNNLIVDINDFFIFRDAFGTVGPDADLNGDGIVDINDFFIFRDLYGLAPGPSGLVP